MSPGGDLTVESADGREYDPASRLLEEGDRVRSGERAITLQTAPATGVRVAAGSQIELEQLTADATSMRLVSGELFAEVRPLAGGSTFQIHVGDLRVVVRGTGFRIARLDQRTLVEVAHGLVSVEREGGGAVLVPAPGRLEIADGDALAVESVGHAVSLTTAEAFPLSLPDRSLQELSREPVPAPLASTEVVVAEAPKPAAAPERPQPRLAHPDARFAAHLRDAMVGCLRGHQHELNGCYEEALRANPQLGGGLTLSVSIDPTGAIRSVKADHAAGFVECARESFRRCEQPGTGEGEELEIPLRFSQR
jgi:hypothetical protein